MIRGDEGRWWQRSSLPAALAGVLPGCFWHNRRMTGHTTQPRSAEGVVAWFDDEEGWGVIDAAEVPGGCFVHFSEIHMDVYRSPAFGQRVIFRFERAPGLQDGYAYRALDVWLQD